MKKILKLKIFWIVFVITTGIIFVALINFNRVYCSQTEVLIVPKNILAVKDSNQIIENLEQIPLTLSFYKEMIQKNDEVANEAILELPDYKKKNYWNSKIKIERIGKSGILKIITLDEDRYQATVLDNQATKTLIDKVNFYYKTNLSLKVLDSLITKNVSNIFNYILFLESIIGAFLLSFLSFFISFNLFKKEETLKIIYPDLLFQKNYNKNYNKIQNQNKYNSNSVFTKTANAPRNLPIAQSFPTENKKQPELKTFTLEKELEKAKPKEKEVEIKSEKENLFVDKNNEKADDDNKADDREATPEEVKERLNKLLSGKF
ncbi:MAG TPA: hypothetical protein ENL05_00425 [Candidatus Moranbacteria bacterium]|nr:hypothetical protein [Candidatus Moranbacteria bacterium]